MAQYEFIGWFKVGVIVGLDLAFFLWLIIEAYWDRIERWLRKVLKKK